MKPLIELRPKGLWEGTGRPLDRAGSGTGHGSRAGTTLAVGGGWVREQAT